MRIDNNLCQRILIDVEADPMGGTGQFLNLSVDGYDDTTIAHHVKYLWDAKLVTGVDVTHHGSPYAEIRVQDLTPKGRAFLDEREPERAPKKFGF
jgi:hypothetical protein